MAKVVEIKEKNLKREIAKAITRLFKNGKDSQINYEIFNGTEIFISIHKEFGRIPAALVAVYGSEKEAESYYPFLANKDSAGDVIELVDSLIKELYSKHRH